MRFPERDRFIYASNPLAEVVCQVRFPRVFEIEANLPVEFQNTIKEYYPLLETRNTINLSISIGSEIRRAE